MERSPAGCRQSAAPDIVRSRDHRRRQRPPTCEAEQYSYQMKRTKIVLMYFLSAARRDVPLSGLPIKSVVEAGSRSSGVEPVLWGAAGISFVFVTASTDEIGRLVQSGLNRATQGQGQDPNSSVGLRARRPCTDPAERLASNGLCRSGGIEGHRR